MNLNLLRRKIDRIDRLIIKNLADRMLLVKNIKQLKEEKNIPVTNKLREKKILAKIGKLAEKVNLDKKFIKIIFHEIFKYSKNIQK